MRQDLSADERAFLMRGLSTEEALSEGLMSVDDLPSSSYMNHPNFDWRAEFANDDDVDPEDELSDEFEEEEEEDREETITSRGFDENLPLPN